MAQQSQPAVRFEAMNVNIESLPDEQVSETHTESGGYKIEAIAREDQHVETFHAQALNINGYAMATSSMTIGEHNETVIIEQETEGGYANLIIE